MSYDDWKAGTPAEHDTHRFEEEPIDEPEHEPIGEGCRILEVREHLRKCCLVLERITEGRVIDDHDLNDIIAFARFLGYDMTCLTSTP